ncbi:DUF1707 domain-containing protein [Actinoplanes sp. M2I2]|uniref:DUF1707 SHOCT-like domain-containing protein n=1 Tax=Actinoplanes sp. M2I2 TaxID=1734444 RepID=UPI00202070A9|nr:DUF1707 domain-containing protein [Actinoplanes sp. M2I2]
MAEMSREQMRAADEDRRQVADQLRLALEEGRLDLTEYDERIQGAYAAKTYAELDRLLTDLPNAAPLVPAQPVAVPVPAPEGVRAAWMAHVWGSWAKAVAFFTLIWGVTFLASTDAVIYWPVWIVGPWGLLLLVRTAVGLANGEPRKHAEETEHRRRLREHKRHRKALQARAVAAGELPAKPTKEQRRAFIAEAVARGDLPPKPRRPE